MITPPFAHGLQARVSQILGTYVSILITGGGGMLARAVARALGARSKEAVGLSRPQLDITDPAAVAQAFEQYRPTLLINCAAYTKVDKCEQERDLAFAVNGRAVETLATQAAKHHTKLVHFSTDFVFDGSKREPYKPDDATNPRSVYGQSKLLGEQLATRYAPDCLIVRTAWLYGPGGPCFPRTMVELARAKKPLRVVDDQIGSPTFTYDLADATLRLLDTSASGIFHVANHGSVNWFAFTRAILEEFDEQTELTPITSDDWARIRPDSAPRPAYSVLDVSAYESLTGQRMRPWRVALRDYRVEVSRDGF